MFGKHEFQSPEIIHGEKVETAICCESRHRSLQVIQSETSMHTIYNHTY